MASNETHELLVQVRPDTGDTKEELDSVGDSFEGTADETERTAGILGDMSSRMQGFAGIVVGTLVTLAAGIASQVPVIQENASALGAVIDAIALRIDEKLRPSMGQLNQDIFALADAIARGEGELGALRNVIGDVLILIGQRLPGMFGGAVTALGVFLRNWDEMWPAAKDTLDSFINDVRFGWEVFWGLLNRRVKVAANNILSDIANFVNSGIRMLNKLPGFDLSTVTAPQLQVRSRQEIVQAAEARRAAREGRLEPKGGGQAGGVDSRQVSRIIQALQNANRTTTLEVDGREVARVAEPFLGEGAANAGRVNRVR